MAVCLNKDGEIVERSHDDIMRYLATFLNDIALSRHLSEVNPIVYPLKQFDKFGSPVSI